MTRFEDLLRASSIGQKEGLDETSDPEAVSRIVKRVLDDAPQTDHTTTEPTESKESRILAAIKEEERTPESEARDKGTAHVEAEVIDIGSRRRLRQGLLAFAIAAALAVLAIGSAHVIGNSQSRPGDKIAGNPVSTLASMQPTAGSPSGRPTDAPSQSPQPSDDAPTQVESSSRPPVLDKKNGGRDLTMSDFFAAPDDWDDGHFDVAGQRDVAGISGPLSYCASDQGSHTTLELRLANRFKKITMKVGQSDNSEQSDAVLNVRLIGNGKYIDSVKVPFNRNQSFSASVADVNALKIEVWIGGDKCVSPEQVGAVLSGMRLE